MWLLAIEALGAFFLFAFIVWWTMFSGRKPKAPKNKPTKSTKSTKATQQSTSSD